MLIFRKWQCWCCFHCGLQRLPIYWLRITVTKSLFNYLTYKYKNHWPSAGTHLNISCIQNLLPLLIVVIIIWTYWLAFWVIATRPFDKAEPSTILALVALVLLKFIYLAKWYISKTYFCHWVPLGVSGSCRARIPGWPNPSILDWCSAL